MYHFFTDLDSIVAALAHRHMVAILEYEKERDKEVVDWGRLTREETIDRYLEPFEAYATAHPDLLVVMRMSGKSCDDASTGISDNERARVERILSARLPQMKPAERRTRAATMLTLVCGLTESSEDPSMPQKAVMMRELRTVLAAYLRAIEKGH